MVWPMMSTTTAVGLLILEVFRNPVKVFLRILVVAFHYSFKVPADWLYDQVYKGKSGQQTFGVFFALCVGVGTAYGGAIYLRWKLLKCLVIGITNALWTYLYRWPFIFLAAIRPVVRFGYKLKEAIL